MKNPAPQSRRRGKATLNVAVWLLVLVLVGQLGAIGWAMWKKRQPTPLTASPPSPAASVDLAEPAREELPAADLTAASTAPLPAVEPAPAAPAVPTLDTPLTENAQVFFRNGLLKREGGDTSAALVQFRAALSLEPNHPRLLYELARTYDMLKLTDKSREVWTKLLQLGEGAGPYYKLAAEQFEQGDQPPAREVPRLLQLGQILERREANPLAKQEMTLRIPVQAVDGATIDPEQVEILIQFYDNVGGRVKKTSAETPTATWLSGAPTWLTTSVEFLEQTYRLPRLPSLPLDGAEEADRAYHGYIVKLYYNNSLQDIVTKPKELALADDEEKLPTVDMNPPSRRRPANQPPFGPSSGPALDDSLFPLPQ